MERGPAEGLMQTTSVLDDFTASAANWMDFVKLSEVLGFIISNLMLTTFLVTFNQEFYFQSFTGVPNISLSI